MLITWTRSVLCGATLIAASLTTLPSRAHVVPAGPVTVYDEVLTTSPAAVANPNVSSFANCLAAEGCLGRDGLVDVAGGNLPDTLTFTFSLTPAEVAAVMGGAGTQGTLTVVASRDVGHKAGAAADDFMTVAADGVGLGSLFINTIDTCPAGERGAAYDASLICGPNFHTDVTASDFLSMTAASVLTFVADGTVQVVLNPSDLVGRLKIFSVELEITQTAPIPEPATWAMLVLGLGAVGVAARRRR
jgi:hypothetical protein